jgi:hypothetical protein
LPIALLDTARENRVVRLKGNAAAALSLPAEAWSDNVSAYIAI